MESIDLVLPITVVIIVLIKIYMYDDRNPKATLSIVGKRPVEDLINELYGRRDEGETMVLISGEDWPEMNSLLFRHHLRLELIELNIWFNQYSNDNIKYLRVQVGSKEV